MKLPTHCPACALPLPPASAVSGDGTRAFCAACGAIIRLAPDPRVRPPDGARAQPPR